MKSTKLQNTITVLGQTFNSDEDRRAYFREELRKKLPELKKMEGFPIGEEEDILNLSDPPYYTACPNPWLNDFIKEWEAEKKELENEGKRKANFEVTEPYTSDISSGKNNPIYNAHSYHTKVPHPAIMRYILKYTQPGDIIFDGFAGTGMTGVAAQSCGAPSLEDKSIIEQEYSITKDEINWGLRKSICLDLSSAASFISYNFNREKKLERFKDESETILKNAYHQFGFLYQTRHLNNTKCKINFVVWSDIFECVNCGNEIIFWNQAVDHNNKTSHDTFPCPNCNFENSKKSAKRIFKNEFDVLLNKPVKVAKVIPVLINYSFNKKRFEKEPDEYDLQILQNLNFNLGNFEVPINELPDGYNLNQPRNSHGVTHAHQFYTKRNLIVLSFIFKEIKKYNNPDLLGWFTSTLTWCGRENRLHLGNYFNKKGGAITSLRGTWYISSLSVETNVIDRFKLRTRSAIFSSKNHSFNSLISTQSATHLENIQSSSVDYIFIDPPFGANLMYSELNIIWESWLKVWTNNNQEAIINTSQKKNIFDYQTLIEKSFKNFFRILKPGKWMTVEFSNTNAAIWNGIQNALSKSGFIIANLSGLDKKKGSFKAVTTTTAVKQDLVISCYKPSSNFDLKFENNKNSEMGIWDFLEEHFQKLPIHLIVENSTTVIIERSPKILFDRLIAFYVQRGLPVPIDAGKFQQALREHFIERDGMFFTNEQVVEYDRKKAEVPNFVQMNIFVANEQDAIYWLRNTLEKATKTEQDLHPNWMKEVVGNIRKGDILPEMRTILEENFLKDDGGKWYVPNPENEADLEKLRLKRLLKQFDAYKTEASKPKGKIKEARVEALRAGFKQSYQDKDFKTIIQVGDRIPNNLLMEDEVLLQFYDIASSRV